MMGHIQSATQHNTTGGGGVNNKLCYSLFPSQRFYFQNAMVGWDGGVLILYYTPILYYTEYTIHQYCTIIAFQL